MNHAALLSRYLASLKSDVAEAVRQLIVELRNKGISDAELCTTIGLKPGMFDQVDSPSPTPVQSSTRPTSPSSTASQSRSTTCSPRATPSQLVTFTPDPNTVAEIERLLKEKNQLENEKQDLQKKMTVTMDELTQKRQDFDVVTKKVVEYRKKLQEATTLAMETKKQVNVLAEQTQSEADAMQSLVAKSTRVQQDIATARALIEEKKKLFEQEQINAAKLQASKEQKARQPAQMVDKKHSPVQQEPLVTTQKAHVSPLYNNPVLEQKRDSSLSPIPAQATLEPRLVQESTIKRKTETTQDESVKKPRSASVEPSPPASIPPSRTPPLPSKEFKSFMTPKAETHIQSGFSFSSQGFDLQVEPIPIPLKKKKEPEAASSLAAKLREQALNSLKKKKPMDEELEEGEVAPALDPLHSRYSLTATGERMPLKKGSEANVEDELDGSITTEMAKRHAPRSSTGGQLLPRNQMMQSNLSVQHLASLGLNVNQETLDRANALASAITQSTMRPLPTMAAPLTDPRAMFPMGAVPPTFNMPQPFPYPTGMMPFMRPPGFPMAYDPKGFFPHTKK